jgi:hypothetical protein
MDDLDRLAADLLLAGHAAGSEVQAVVAKGALNIKNDWREGWSGLAHAPALPAAISYETTVHVGDISAEIGPDKDKRQGALGNLLEFGTATSGPHPAGQQALDREEPRFIAAIEALAARLI